MTLFFLFAAGASVLLPLRAAQPSPQQETPQQVPPSPSSPGSFVVVIDPAHGGTDSGARGEAGTVEKDIVLEIARSVRAELERQGFRVLMTRNDDSNMSYDDRAAVANTHRDAVFISLHVSSTGTAGTVRAYCDQFGTPFPPAPATTPANTKPANLPTSTLPPWDEAQRPYVETSHRLADLVQAQLAQGFSGSPVLSTGVAIRGLRSVAAPAVAIEISSVSVSDPSSLTGSAAPIATAIAHGLQTFRSSGGAN